MPFFHYSQNNSGGFFQVIPAAGISQHVIVEARDAKDADERAEGIGLYFDGSGDCECCGTRWSSLSDWSTREGTSEPMIWDTPAERYRTGWSECRPAVFVHYLDGRVAAHGD